MIMSSGGRRGIRMRLQRNDSTGAGHRLLGILAVIALAIVIVAISVTEIVLHCVPSSPTTQTVASGGEWELVVWNGNGTIGTHVTSVEIDDSNKLLKWVDVLGEPGQCSYEPGVDDYQIQRVKGNGRVRGVEKGR